MFGYWANEYEETQQPTQGGTVITVGLPPCMRATRNGNYTEGLYIAGEGSDWARIELTDVNVRCFKKTLNPGTYATPDWPYADKDGDYYMYLPNGFKGYITEAIDGAGTNFNTILKPDVNAAVITSQQVYKIGIDVYKLVFPELGGAAFHTGSIYGDIEKAGQIFKNRLFDKTNIPVFTGSFRSGGSGGSGVATFKQNRHYAAVGSDNANIDLLTPGMMPRYHIYGNNNYNTNTYGSGSMDTMFSNANAEQGVLRNGYTTIGNKVYDWATSGSNAGYLPWFFNCTGSYRVTYNSTSGNLVDTTRPRITPINSRADVMTFRKSNCVLVNNTGNTLWQDRYGWDTDPRQIAMPLPVLPQNEKIYGGTGNGVLDVPVIDVYQHPRVPEWSFRYDDPARYAFVECNNSTTVRTAIFIVTYLTNDIITITT